MQIDRPSSFTALAAEDRQRVVHEHAWPSLMTFFPVVALVGVMEWITRPTHRTAVVVVGTLYIGIGAACLALLRWRPQWAVAIAVGGVSALCAAMLSYSPMVRGSGELCVLAMTVLLGGFAVAFPLGLRNQLLSSIVPVVGYAVVLQIGTTTAYPIWYSASSLIAFLFVLAVGARGIDQYRSRILLNGFEQAALAAENARLRDEADEANRAKTDLMSILSHELRAPLFGIRMLSEILGESSFDDRDEWMGIVERITHQSKQAGDLVQAMLELGSMQTGAIRASVEDFDIVAMLRCIRAEISVPSHAPNLSLRWDIPRVMPVMRSDRGKIEAILRNLLHNALRHTESGAVIVRATFDDGRDQVRFTVIDTGEGIAPEALPKIFERFARATSLGDGYGLGLYIVKRFVDVLGGSVSVDSIPGSGSCFAVTLPRTMAVPVVAAARAA